MFVHSLQFLVPRFVPSPHFSVPRFGPRLHFLVPMFFPSHHILLPRFVPSPSFLVPTITRNLKKNSFFMVRMIFLEIFHIFLMVTRHGPFKY